MGKRRSLHCSQSCSAIRGMQYDVVVLCKDMYVCMCVYCALCVVLYHHTMLPGGGRDASHVLMKHPSLMRWDGTASVSLSLTIPVLAFARWLTSTSTATCIAAAPAMPRPNQSVRIGTEGLRQRTQHTNLRSWHTLSPGICAVLHISHSRLLCRLDAVADAPTLEDIVEGGREAATMQAQAHIRWATVPCPGLR